MIEDGKEFLKIDPPSSIFDPLQSRLATQAHGASDIFPNSLHRFFVRLLTYHNNARSYDACFP